MRLDRLGALVMVLLAACSESTALRVSPDELERSAWATQTFRLSGLSPSDILESDGQRLGVASDLHVMFGPGSAAVLAIEDAELLVRLEAALPLGQHDVKVHAHGVDHVASRALRVWSAGDGDADSDADGDGDADGDADADADADADGDADADADADADGDADADADGDADADTDSDADADSDSDADADADGDADPPCARDEDCDDGIFCNGPEVCLGAEGCGRGLEPSCDDGVSCTLDGCDAVADACRSVQDDAACDDGQVCTGVETCDLLLGCVAGAPVTCDDGVSCTMDTCDEVGGMCQNVPDHGACPAGEVCAVPQGGCFDAACFGDVDCDDGSFCNGAERCVAFGCVPGPAPSCVDGLACTTDGCSDELAACVSTSPDADLDGFGDAGCAGSDCDDEDPARHPGALELCNGTDDDCDGLVDEDRVGAGGPCAQDAECCSGRCEDGTCGVPHCRFDPDCGGGIGGLCTGDPDCLEGICCTTANCGGGMCTYECDKDDQCPSDMLCEHGVCFFTCSSASDCAPGAFCKHANTICEWN